MAKYEEPINPSLVKLHKLFEGHEQLAIETAKELKIGGESISYEEAMGLARQVVMNRNKLITAIIEANNEQ